MHLASFQKTTFLDYPGKIAALVFTSGCNMQCGFCHNPELVRGDIKNTISEEDFFSYIAERRNLLDGVCITGGEPTLHRDLPKFIKRIKDNGLLVKLDTNGTNPEMVKNLMQDDLVDYLAMDIKSSIDYYPNFLCKKDLVANIQTTKDIIQQSPVEYEFRTTVIKGIHTKQMMKDIALWIQGASRYYIQNFMMQSRVLQEDFAQMKGFLLNELDEFQQIMGEYVDYCGVRNQ